MIARIADACLVAGGYGVQMVTAGTAHSAGRWRNFRDEPDSIAQLHALFVAHMIMDKDAHYSCGMHQFGLRDTVVMAVPYQEAFEIAVDFELYQLIDAPNLKSGETFSVGHNAPAWRIQSDRHPYHDDEFLDRSTGAWCLEKEEPKKSRSKGWFSKLGFRN